MRKHPENFRVCQIANNKMRGSCSLLLIGDTFGAAVLQHEFFMLDVIIRLLFFFQDYIDLI